MATGITYMSRNSLYLALAASAILSLGLLLGVFTVYTWASQAVEVDVCADIRRVVDGDTFDAFPVGRVRLADIDAPEIDTPEGELAKQALLSLVSTYGPRVYLDVDDIYVMDRYNRIIAVAYLRYNETHAININMWLASNGHASISDYRNEFDPYTWVLYKHLPRDPCVRETAVTTITRLSTVTATITSTTTSTTTVTQTLAAAIKTPEIYTKTVTTTLATTVAIERTATVTRVYSEAYTLVATVTTTVVKEDWVLAVLVGVIAIVLFTVGYSLGRRLGRQSGF